MPGRRGIFQACDSVAAVTIDLAAFSIGSPRIRLCEEGEAFGIYGARTRRVWRHGKMEFGNDGGMQRRRRVGPQT